MSRPHALPSVSATEVPAGAALLDVREDDEWAAGRIPGAVHVPLAELPGRLAELPAGDPLVVVCRVGGRSAQAVAWLAAQGRPALNLDGGMLAWAAAGRPMEATSGPPQVV